MASKKELVDKIQTIAKRIYAAKTKQSDTLGVEAEDVNFDTELFPILTKFPALKQVIINLLTEQYEDFISDIYWVAPRPTTFKIILANNQIFYLIYTERSWIAKVEGKKYYLLNLNEEMRAAESIARILAYGGGAEPDKEAPTDTVPTGGETPADETTPEAPPVEEPPAEEVPEELPA
jgi:hypothetical protein